MFTLRQYLTTLADTHGLTKTLGGMEVCRDSRDRMCYTVGNSAIVFRVRHEGRIRSLRCYMHPPRHLAEIYGERLLPQELYLYDSPRSGVWVDVVLGDWIEGTTLHEAVAEAAAAEDTARLRQLAAAFDRLAAGLTSDDWAHGDLKPENIVVDPSGRLHLIDLQHPARTIRDFNASLDDYPAALISTALHALALDPALYVRYPDADGLLFSPQQIRTDEALREAIALFEGEGLAVQYRIARLLYAPTPRLFGLPELLACAARAGGPPSGGNEGAETTGNTCGYKSGGTDGATGRDLVRNTGRGTDKRPGGKTGGESFADMGGGARNDGTETFPELFVGNGLWGYRTPEQIVIPPLYDCGFDFTEGLAAVRLGGTWHYIDTEGHTRIRCPGCEAVKPFRNGRAEVIRDGRRLEIDRAGREQESGSAVSACRSI